VFGPGVTSRFAGRTGDRRGTTPWLRFLEPELICYRTGMNDISGIPFKEVFDLAKMPDRWRVFSLFIITIPALALALAIAPRRFHDFLDRIPLQGITGLPRRIFALFVFTFSSLILWGAGYDHFRQVENDLALERSGNLSLVEGCLQSFHPMPADGHENERILVNGKAFSYSDFDESTPGFNNTLSHGGPIHADSAVRIHYVGNTIVKLAVRDHACRPAPDLLR